MRMMNARKNLKRKFLQKLKVILPFSSAWHRDVKLKISKGKIKQMLAAVSC